MARFVREGDTLHVYPGGRESNIGVYDGVETVHFHDGVNLGEVIAPDITAKHIVMDDVNVWWQGNLIQTACFPYAETVVWDIETAPHCISNLLVGGHIAGKPDPVLNHDVRVTLCNKRHGIEETFFFKRMSKGLFDETVITLACGLNYQELRIFEAVKELQCYCRGFYRFYHPMLWVELFFSLTDITGKDSTASREFIRRRAGREVKQYFFQLTDALVIRLINEDLLTKATMKALLDMANDDGRIDVAAAILNKTAPKRRATSRFAI